MLQGAFQSQVDLYVSSETFEEISRAFPYIVSKEFGSDVSASHRSFHIGGKIAKLHCKQVPKFNWHVIEGRKPFTIGDIRVVLDLFKGARVYKHNKPCLRLNLNWSSDDLEDRGRGFPAPPVDFTLSLNSVYTASTRPSWDRACADFCSGWFNIDRP